MAPLVSAIERKNVDRFLGLPQEMIHTCLSYLTFKEIAKTTRTAKNWQGCVSEFFNSSPIIIRSTNLLQITPKEVVKKYVGNRIHQIVTRIFEDMERLTLGQKMDCKIEMVCPVSSECSALAGFTIHLSSGQHPSEVEKMTREYLFFCLQNQQEVHDYKSDFLKLKTIFLQLDPSFSQSIPPVRELLNWLNDFVAEQAPVVIESLSFRRDVDFLNRLKGASIGSIADQDKLELARCAVENCLAIQKNRNETIIELLNETLKIKYLDVQNRLQLKELQRRTNSLLVACDDLSDKLNQTSTLIFIAVFSCLIYGWIHFQRE